VTPLADPHASSNCALPGLRGTDVTPARGPVTSPGGGQDLGALTDLLRRLNWHTRGLPLMVLENGVASEDEPGARCRVRDTERVDHIAAPLRAVHAAIAEGVDVRGYFAWSLLDNLESSAGCSQRFGNVHVDVETCQRTVEDSATFYRDTIAWNAIPGEA
jgi:beta-glucosidase